MIRGSIHRAVVASSSFLAAAATSSFFYFRIPLSPQADALVFSCRLLRVAWFTITIVGSVRYTQTTHHGCPSTHNSWCAYALRSASRPSSVPKTASEIRIETQITSRVVVQNNTEIVRTKEQFKQWRSKTGGVYIPACSNGNFGNADEVGRAAGRTPPPVQHQPKYSQRRRR